MRKWKRTPPKLALSKSFLKPLRSGEKRGYFLSAVARRHRMSNWDCTRIGQERNFPLLEVTLRLWWSYHPSIIAVRLCPLVELRSYFRSVQILTQGSECFVWARLISPGSSDLSVILLFFHGMTPWTESASLSAFVGTDLPTREYIKI